MTTHLEARRVLVIASAFPPAGGSGVQRTTKFVKYLPTFGWTPIVWTCGRHPGLPTDGSLLEDLPEDIEVHRHGGGVCGLAPTLMESVGRCANRAGLLGAASRRIDWRLRAWQARATHPDSSAGWANSSVRPLLQIVVRDGIDVVYSTFSPASNHLLASRIHEATGLPWIADFRDLWTDDYRYRPATPAIHAADRRLEQHVLQTAHAVIGVSPSQTAILASHVPTQRSKFVTITNGFDPTDFEAEEVRPKPPDGVRRFVLAHVGRFDQWRTPDVWFAGLSRFVAMLGADRDSVDLRIVGHVDQRTSARLDETGVHWTRVGEVSHGDAIREMRSADALLLNVPGGPHADSVIPAKLFEYLAAKRPILVVGPEDGASQDIVQTLGAGVAVNFNADVIAFALNHLYMAWLQGEPDSTTAPVDLQPYSRVALTQRLARLLDRVACTPRRLSDPPRPTKELQLT